MISSKKGLTLLEIIIVLVIVAIVTAMGIAKQRRGIENQQAKAVLQTLKSITHAARLYEVTKGGTGAYPPDLQTLETVDAATGTRYLDPSEYAYRPPYQYSYAPNSNVATAVNANNGRTIAVHLCPNNKSQDGQIDDSFRFLTAPAPANC